MKTILIALAFVLSSSIAHAQSDTPMDMTSIDQNEFKDFLGLYVISDQSGKKQCRVRLKSDETIGGMAIDINKKCSKVFPVMSDVSSWRLNEGWTIVLADATRKTLLRFYTPDNDYISDKEIDGIFTIKKK